MRCICDDQQWKPSLLKARYWLLHEGQRRPGDEPDPPLFWPSWSFRRVKCSKYAIDKRWNSHNLRLFSRRQLLCVEPGSTIQSKLSRHSLFLIFARPVYHRREHCPTLPLGSLLQPMDANQAASGRPSKRQARGTRNQLKCDYCRKDKQKVSQCGSVASYLS